MVISTSSLAVQSQIVLVQLSFKTKFAMRLQIRRHQLIGNNFDYFQLKHVTISSLAVSLPVCTDCPRFRPLLAIVSRKKVFEILERAELAEFQDQWYAAIMKQTFPRVIIT